MKEKLLPISKIILGVAMIGIALWQSIDFSAFWFVFTFEICPFALIIGGIALIFDATLNFHNDCISPVVYRNVAVCLLFSLVNSFLTMDVYLTSNQSNELSKIPVLLSYGKLPFFIIGRIILPFIFIAFYLIVCKEKKLRLDNYFSGLILFTIALIPQATLTGVFKVSIYYQTIIEKPLESMQHLGISSLDSIVLLIILSVLIGNLLLIFLNRLTFKIIRRPKDLIRNRQIVKKNAAV